MSSLNTTNQNSLPIINKLDVRKYLIPLELHQELFENSNKHFIRNGFTPINKHTADGIYLISFRRLNKNSNTLIYNYIKYPYLFLGSLIVYLLLRSYYINYKEFSDKRHYFVILDASLTSEYTDYIRPKNDNSGINTSYLSTDVNNYLENIGEISNINILIELLNHIMFVGKIDDICYVLEKSVLKEFDMLTRFVFNGYNISENLVKYKEDNILNSSLYVVKDLNLLIDSIQKKGYDVNEGPQKWRGQINSISSFLNILDLDYRESLFNHYQYHRSIGVLDPKTYSPLKAKSFSFNTVHQNMGNVRWYSSNSRPVLKGSVLKRSFHSTTNLKKSQRVTMFEDNFILLKDLINQNKNLDNKDLQKKIENMLFNQESSFADKNIIKSRLNISELGYDFLNKKRTEIKKLLAVPYTKVNKRPSISTELLPWCEKIQKEFKDDVIIDNLFSYFMLMLTRENVIMEDEVAPGIPTTAACTEFGKILCNKYVYKKYMSFLKDNPNSPLTFSQYMSSRVEFNDMDKHIFYPRIGGYFLNYLKIVNILIEQEDQHITNRKEVMKYLRIYPDCRSLFIKNNIRIFHLPMKLPMICPPKPYNYSENTMKNIQGGFLMNDVLYSSAIMNKKIGYANQTKLSDNNTIVDEVNGMGCVPFKVNTDTLNFVIEYGISKRILLDPEVEGLDQYISNPYTGYSKRDSKKFRSLLSKWLMERNILNIASIYSNFEKIYFPTRLDFRTRVYCNTDYFSYQSNDLARGLILFAEPGKILKHDITAINYFKAFGANMFGSSLDKKSLSYRVKWIDENSDILLNFYNNDIVDKAEEKISFISFCFEYKRFMDFIKDNNRSVFYTYLPIRLDASCNCYQHLALLTKENVIYDKLNLASSTFDDDPDDFYTFMNNRINVYIRNKVDYLKKSIDKLDEKTQNLLNSYEILLAVCFDRSIVKKTIMTDSYHAGLAKLIDFICKNLNEQYEGKNKYYTYKNPDIKIKRSDISNYVLALKHVLSSEAPKIKELSKYLDSIATICTKLDMVIPWKLPNGAEISGSYLQHKDENVRAFSFVKTRYTFRKYLEGEYDLQQQKRSLPPNLIHSLDATTISLLYSDFKRIGPIYTVHDCFAVTADKVDKLISKLRLVYTELYSDAGYLMKFDGTVRININNKHGDKVFKVDSDRIYKYDSKKEKIIEIPFPDVTKVVNYDINNLHLNNAMNSSYLLI